MAKPIALNSCQTQALEELGNPSNVFLTGVAGSGKSFLIRHFLRSQESSDFPVLASTGAAAILVGGRTFHSFFGLGIMQGGLEATVDRAAGNSRLVKRLRKAEGVVIDEISMISGTTLRAAEKIARRVRANASPWGGLKVIVVGDFAQLPPVTQSGQSREWAFQDESWLRSEFRPALLRTIVRTEETDFLEILNDVREGRVTEEVRRFLDQRTVSQDDDAWTEFEGTRLFPHRDTVEKFNLERLSRIEGAARTFTTLYIGAEKSIEDLKRFAPIPEVLTLKQGALVMIRMNDPQGRWVNGSLGHIQEISPLELHIKLLKGSVAHLEMANFTLLDAEGKEVASARNFPVNLAYASTIHKAQGMTLDRVMVDLRNLWEPGQAYVALSRVTSAKGLHVAAWTPRSIQMDPAVSRFYSEIMGNA